MGRKIFVHRLLLSVPGLLLSGVIAGCYNYENDTVWTNNNDPPGIWSGPPPIECTPAPGKLVADTCGNFVSASGSDDNPGTQAAPFATLTYALTKNKPIYACTEEFKETLTLSAGSSLFGGFDCKAGWKYAGGEMKTVLHGDNGKPALTISAPIIDGAPLTMVADFRIIASDATAAGASSIAVWVDGGSATLARCDLIAGQGAQGVTGEHKDADPMLDGKAGDPGKGACDAESHSGATGKVKECSDGSQSIGGNGGYGGAAASTTPPAAGSGSDGIPTMSMPGGKGGVAEPEAPGDPSVACTSGTGGSDGNVGGPGEGAVLLGTLSEMGYSGTKGGDGTPGKPGQGGGGGGGSKGAQAQCDGKLVPITGSSGGSGGTGGCGGAGGGGGSSGGASIALVSRKCQLTLTQVTLKADKGGDGGTGGTGQVGGQKGGGGTFAPIRDKVKPSCSGGDGGNGGIGGPGGGGLGGPSIGLAYTGIAPKLDEQQITIATGGQGGVGGLGNMAINNGKGADGFAEKLHAFD